MSIILVPISITGGVHCFTSLERHGEKIYKKSGRGEGVWWGGGGRDIVGNCSV